MGNVLYRKYRSKNLSEIVGQPHITTTLDNALKQGKIAHAYLFTGPKGVGKTSIARILAREINGLTLKQADNHLDIIEIDAASNRRIDEIRELRDKVHNTPAQAPYKVYIIDEVHMLTKEAFNALLKTLEEPPSHAIFILATTEAHKLPDTIISRTQRFTFKPVATDAVTQHLRMISKKESITISDEALTMIAEHGQGSFRDSISLLDQIRYVGTEADEITAGDVTATIGVAPDSAISALIDTIGQADAKTVLAALEQLIDQGYNPVIIASQIAKKIRSRIIHENHASSNDTLLLKNLTFVSASNDPTVMLEVTLLDYAITDFSAQPKARTTDQPKAEPAGKPTSATQKAPEKKTNDTPPEPAKASQKERGDKQVKTSAEEVPATKHTPPEVSNGKQADAAEIWTDVLNSLKGSHNTLYGMARMAQPSIEDGVFVLECKYSFHMKRLSDERHKKIIHKAIADSAGNSYGINCILAENKPAKSKPKRPELPPENENLKSINNIFGSTEVLES